MYKPLSHDFATMCDFRAQCHLTTTPDTLKNIKMSDMAETRTIFWSPLKTPMGYLIWADVNRETILRLYRSGRLPQFDFEWREGKITLILDVVLDPRWKKYCLQSLRGFIASKRIVTYVRKGKLKLLLRDKGRHRIQSFALKKGG